LLASEDDRIALRAAIEVFDRVLGPPKQQPARGRSFEQWPDMDAALASAHEKLAERLGPYAARDMTSG